jgi:hypothetical protein
MSRPVGFILIGFQRNAEMGLLFLFWCLAVLEWIFADNSRLELLARQGLSPNRRFIAKIGLNSQLDGKNRHFYRRQLPLGEGP